METGQPEIRRTKAVVVKALCDILRPVIDGLVVLELFAGSARVSRSLLDEGASKAYAVDLKPQEEALERESLTVYTEDVFTFLGSGPPKKIDLVFMDPPYESDYIAEILPCLPEYDWLSSQGLVALETSAENFEFPPEITGEGGEGFYLMRNRNYGGTRLVLYQADRAEPAIEG